MEYKYKDDGDFKKVSLNRLTTKHHVVSDQALGAIMMALQNSLMHQTDIVPVLKDMKFVVGPKEELVVLNPPILRVNEEDAKV